MFEGFDSKGNCLQVVTNGREYSLKLKKNKKQLSKLQQEAVSLIKEKYPLYNIYTEVQIPGTKMYIDIFIPGLRLVVEVHGEQHYKYTRYFHGDEIGKYRSDNRDLAKQSWCEENNLKYAELPFNEISEWPTLLTKALTE